MKHEESDFDFGDGFVVALKPCRECGKKVSTEAQSCPNCGAPHPTHKAETKIEPTYSYKFGEVEIENTSNEIINVNQNDTYARCEKSFCTNRYEILTIPKAKIGKELCSGCGNKLKKVKKQDAISSIQNKQSKPKNQPVIIQQNLIEKIWWGNETLGTIFWMYCILTVGVVSFVSGFAFETVGVIIFVIPGLVIIWTNTGLWRCSEKYKSSQLKRNQSYGWATAAKVYVVLNYITTLSQLGLNLPK